MTRYLWCALGLAVTVAFVAFSHAYPAQEPLLPPTVEKTDRGVLPADEPDGWEIDLYDNPVKTFARDNLCLYAPDKVDRCLEYGFVKLTHGVYRPNLLGKPTVIEDAYQMDSPLDAYGLFTAERNRENKMANIGGGCSIGEKESVMWKGNYLRPYDAGAARGRPGSGRHALRDEDGGEHHGRQRDCAACVVSGRSARGSRRHVRRQEPAGLRVPRPGLHGGVRPRRAGKATMFLALEPGVKDSADPHAGT